MFVYQSKQRLRIMILTSFILCYTILFAVNQMPIVWQTQGEHPKDQFGTSIVTLDYNADGYDDLVVLSLLFDPAPPGSISEPHKAGRIYFYMGRPDSLFSTTPTFTITRDAIKDTLGLFYKLLSADLNGDGLKDLIVRSGWRPSTYVNCPYAGGIYAFYSGTESDTLMDFRYFVPIAGIDSLSGIFGESDDELYELGDINGDGCDDLGFYYSEIISYSPRIKYNNKFYILYGDPVQPRV